MDIEEEEELIYTIPKHERLCKKQPIIISIKEEEEEVIAIIPEVEKKKIYQDIVMEKLTNKEELLNKNDNVNVACYFAINMYLEPTTVLSNTFYWLSQYTNYERNGENWFIDHIINIIKHPIHLNFSVNEGTTFLHPQLQRHSLLIFD